MAGELVPLVLLPRYTTYAGVPSVGPHGEPPYFSTIAMDVTQFQSAIVNLWRGQLLGTTPGIGFSFEESSDQVTWTACAGAAPGLDPGENNETQYTLTLAKRWFRVAILLGGTDPVCSCWAVGFLEERIS